ncbi:MAG: hypothetical protein L6R41_001979, partial [Letrouitia leprolyta]
RSTTHEGMKKIRIKSSMAAGGSHSKQSRAGSWKQKSGATDHSLLLKDVIAHMAEHPAPTLKSLPEVSELLQERSPVSLHE